MAPLLHACALVHACLLLVLLLLLLLLLLHTRLEPDMLDIEGICKRMTAARAHVDGTPALTSAAAAQDSSAAQPRQPRARASVPGHLRLRFEQRHTVPVLCGTKPYQHHGSPEWVRQPPVVLF